MSVWEGGRGMNVCGGREGRGGKGMNVCVVGGGKREGFFVRVNINRQTCIKGYKICHWSQISHPTLPICDLFSK